MADKDSYLSSLAAIEPKLTDKAPPWLQGVRKTATEQFAEQGFPVTKDEDWRFTRVRPLLGHDFELAAEPVQSNGLGSQLEKLSFADEGMHRIVFVNGHYDESLSSLADVPDGVRVENLGTAVEKDDGSIEKHLSRIADVSKNPFTALNTAHILGGAFIHLPEKAVVEKPIHVLFATRSGDKSVASHPRTLVVAETGSRATVVESYVGLEEELYFTNAVTEIVVKDNARLDHCKLQKESRAAYHIGSLQTHVGKDARFLTDNICLGGAFVRNDVGAVLGGEGIDCTLDGLYLAGGSQHVDNHTAIEHANPHCDSHELYKGILDASARAVFNGRIHVHPDAQKTDAKQSNRCILLSDDAQVNTNPQLEIYADDVKCTHGAAVGQIDENAVFYMRARGINLAMAKHMLIHAFANEILEKISVEPLRERLADDLSGWLSSTSALSQSR
jgi:Fe-S cluster assembly protein SufD